MFRPFFFFFLLWSTLSAQNIDVDLLPQRKDKMRIGLFSMHKSGTHLAMRCLKILTRKSIASKGGEALFKKKYLHKYIFVTHFDLLAAPPDLFTKIIVNVRDLRDIAVSKAHLSRRTEYFKNSNPITWIRISKDDRLKLILQDQNTELGILKQSSKLLQLLKKHPNALLIRYEDLVGSMGGGSDKVQHRELKRITHFLDMDIDDNTLKELPKYLDGKKQFFGNDTFRKGTIGQWKAAFNETHKALFKKHLGDNLIELGYEKDHNW